MADSFLYILSMCGNGYAKYLDSNKNVKQVTKECGGLNNKAPIGSCI